MKQLSKWLRDLSSISLTGGHEIIPVIVSELATKSPINFIIPLAFCIPSFVIKLRSKNEAVNHQQARRVYIDNLNFGNRELIEICLFKIGQLSASSVKFSIKQPELEFYTNQLNLLLSAHGDVATKSLEN